MVEIKICDKKYYFNLSMVDLFKLNEKYDGKLACHINEAVYDRDVSKCMSIIEDIFGYSFVGTQADRNIFNSSLCKKAIIDNFVENGPNFQRFINNIMSDKRDRVIKFDFPFIQVDTPRCVPNSNMNAIMLDGDSVKPKAIGYYDIIKYKYCCESSNKEEKSMPANVKITKIVTHNNMVTIVYFSDGSFTKAICSEKDTYDLDVGIQVCLMKKMLGEKRYFKTMKYAHELIEKQEQDKKDAIELKRKRREEQKKREKKNRKLRQQAVDQWKNDITDAVKAAISNKEDDLK